MSLAAPGEVEEKPHLALLVLETRQADRQQVLPLLLCVLLAEVVVGRLRVDLGDRSSKSAPRRSCSPTCVTPAESLRSVS
jgi:hypothetical protein